MVTDYIVPMEKTYALLGPPKTSLQQGVAETVAWLQSPKPTPPQSRQHTAQPKEIFQHS
jgi:hypothetical protein